MIKLISNIEILYNYTCNKDYKFSKLLLQLK